MTYFEYNHERTRPDGEKQVEVEVLTFSLDVSGIEVGEIRSLADVEAGETSLAA